MRAGNLSRAELNQLHKAWAILDGLQAKLPPNVRGGSKEACTLDLLLDARNKAAELLRWQGVDPRAKPAGQMMKEGGR
jgi:hypothetical protein